MTKNIFYNFVFLILLIFLSFPSSTEAKLYLESSDGLKFRSSVDKNYWCKLGLLVKVDSYSLSERHIDKPNRRNNGSTIRKAEFSVSGSLNNHWSYLCKLNWTTFYATYSGFAKDTVFYFGQIIMHFGLENASSNKWSPFLERSLPSKTFSPGYGIGVSFRKVFHAINSTVSASLTTSPYGRRTNGQSNPLQKTLRFTYAPIHEPNEVYHFGFSARYERLRLGESLRFSSGPEIRLRNNGRSFSAEFKDLNFCSCLGLEFATLLGPFCLQSEWMKALVNVKSSSSNIQQALGGYIQASYILTGESREYDFKRGTFGRIRPQTNIGAWDIAYRCSYLNLKTTNLRGGVEWASTFSLGWTVNNHVRIFGNYIIARSHPTNRPKRKLEIFGLRLQWLY
jgi:phosphate-selective porin OprO/OprP